MYNWSNQCWQIHLLITSAHFPITNCLQTDYSCVCYCNCRTDNWSSWAKARNAPQLRQVTGRGYRSTNFTQRTCKIFTWTVSCYFFMMCNWSYFMKIFFSSRLNILNLLINSLIANIFYIWMYNHIPIRLKRCEEQLSSRCFEQYKYPWVVARSLRCSEPKTLFASIISVHSKRYRVDH